MGGELGVGRGRRERRLSPCAKGRPILDERRRLEEGQHRAAGEFVPVGVEVEDRSVRRSPLKVVSRTIGLIVVPELYARTSLHTQRRSSRCSTSRRPAGCEQPSNRTRAIERDAPAQRRARGGQRGRHGTGPASSSSTRSSSWSASASAAMFKASSIFIALREPDGEDRCAWSSERGRRRALPHRSPGPGRRRV